MTMPKGRIKYILAGIGAIYAIVFVGYLVYAGVSLSKKGPSGPSELELHPEKQAEIHARERVEELRNRLKLTDDQVQRVAKIYQMYEPANGPQAGPPDGDFRERFRTMHEEVAKVLTPEQQAIEDQMRGPGGPGGPDGPGEPGGPGRRRGGPPGFMNPERMEALKQVMTPEQKERFEKQMERMKQWRQMRPRGDRGGRGPQPPPPPQ